MRAKAGGGRRSGNGRECRLLRQDSIRSDHPQGTVPARSGHGAQAAAWNASLRFDASPKATTHSSSSTSPETDPGTPDVLPFFQGALVVYRRLIYNANDQLKSRVDSAPRVVWALPYDTRAAVATAVVPVDRRYLIVLSSCIISNVFLFLPRWCDVVNLDFGRQ